MTIPHVLYTSRDGHHSVELLFDISDEPTQGLEAARIAATFTDNGLAELTKDGGKITVWKESCNCETCKPRIGN